VFAASVGTNGAIDLVKARAMVIEWLMARPRAFAQIGKRGGTRFKSSARTLR